MLEGLTSASISCRGGIADAICFAPLNKAALRAGGMNHADEMHWFAEVLASTGRASSSTCSNGCGHRASPRTCR